jgi:cell division septation protein DedD
MIDIQKLTQQKNELKEIWDYLAIESPFPDKEVRRWLLDFTKDMIESAFKVLAEKEEKIEEPVKYISRVLHNAKAQNMTPEERDAQISAMRSAVGKLGAAKSHAKQIAYIKEEFAAVCQDLPKACRNLPLDIGTDLGVGSGSDFDSVSGNGSSSSTRTEQSKPAAAAPPAFMPASEEKNKATPTPKPEEKGSTETATVFGYPIPADICAFHRAELVRASRLADAVAGTAVNDLMLATQQCAKCNPKTKTENPFGSGLKPIRRKKCGTCDTRLERNVNHVCPPPPPCFDCGSAEWDHECRGEDDEAN